MYVPSQFTCIWLTDILTYIYIYIHAFLPHCEHTHTSAFCCGVHTYLHKYIHTSTFLPHYEHTHIAALRCGVHTYRLTYTSTFSPHFEFTHTAVFCCGVHLYRPTCIHAFLPHYQHTQTGVFRWENTPSSFIMCTLSGSDYGSLVCMLYSVSVWHTPHRVTRLYPVSVWHTPYRVSLCAQETRSRWHTQSLSKAARIKRERERERVFTVLYRLMIWHYIRADTPRAIITRPRTLTE